jgi:hypothetical protein
LRLSLVDLAFERGSGWQTGQLAGSKCRLLVYLRLDGWLLRGLLLLE